MRDWHPANQPTPVEPTFAKAVFDELTRPEPASRFSVGIDPGGFALGVVRPAAVGEVPPRDARCGADNAADGEPEQGFNESSKQ